MTSSMSGIGPWLVLSEIWMDSRRVSANFKCTDGCLMASTACDHLGLGMNIKNMVHVKNQCLFLSLCVFRCVCLN